MKILIIRPYPTVMKIDNYNAQEVGMAKSFIKAGHTCDIVYYNGDNEPRTDTVKIDDEKSFNIYWPKSSVHLNNGFLKGIKKLALNYDTILLAEYDQLLCWYFYRFSKNKPYKVYVYHGQYDSNISKMHNLKCKVFDNLLLTKKIKNNLTVFVKSELSKQSLVKKGFKNVFVTGVGVDLTRFQSKTQEKNELIDELKEKKKNLKYLLYIGVFEDRRNILFLIDLYNKILENNPDVRLVLVGKGQKEYTDKCFEKIKQSGLEDKIFYKDALPQSSLAELYELCDLFLLPTKYEIFGMVLLEAMYFNIPVVTSLNGGSSTLIENDDEGLIIDGFDIDDWAEKTVSLLKNTERINTIKINAKKRIAENFTWDEIVKHYLDNM